MDNNNRWPDFFLVGAMKAGTTSIYNYMGKHPRIFIPSRKEPHFFACDACKQRRSLTDTAPSTADDYLDLFRGASDHQLTGDFSVSNLWCRSAAGRIFEKAPSAKIIAVLRNPIERCFSHYVMRVQQSRESRTFTDVIRAEILDPEKGLGYIDFGRYESQIKCYSTLFPSENVGIFLYDDFKNDKIGFMLDILNFIGVDSGLSEKDIDFAANTGGTRRGGAFSFLYNSRQHYLPVVSKILPKSARTKIRDAVFMKQSGYPQMTDQDRALLITVYEKEISSLGNLLGKDLSSWLTNRP